MHADSLYFHIDKYTLSLDIRVGAFLCSYEIRDTRYEIRDTRYEIRDTRYEIRDTRYEIRDNENWEFRNMFGINKRKKKNIVV